MLEEELEFTLSCLPYPAHQMETKKDVPLLCEIKEMKIRSQGQEGIGSYVILHKNWD